MMNFDPLTTHVKKVVRFFHWEQKSAEAGRGEREKFSQKCFSHELMPDPLLNS